MMSAKLPAKGVYEAHIATSEELARVCKVPTGPMPAWVCVEHHGWCFFDTTKDGAEQMARDFNHPARKARSA